MEYQLINNPDSIEVIFTQKEIYERLSNNTFEKLFRDLAERGKEIFLNFQEVEVIDSLMIGAMIVLFHKLKTKNLHMKIMNLTDQLKDFFDKIRLTEYFSSW